MSSSVIPAEDWPPYKWLWTTVVLSRDDEGEPRPYTHGMRANWQTFLAVVLVVLLIAAWNAKRHPLWALLVVGLAMFLTGHVLWAGQPLGVLA